MRDQVTSELKTEATTRIESGVLLDGTAKYKTIVADPPWRYKTTMAVTGNAPGRTRQNGRSATDYPTMTIEEIIALPISKLADPTGCHLYLWTTNTHVENAWRIARAWGFETKNLLTWCKPPKGMIGFGTFSGCTEFVLYAQMGQTVKLARCERTWWEWPRGAHSSKPEAFQDMVESVSPGPYLELFARRQRLGWTALGNGCDGMDIGKSLKLLAQQSSSWC